MKCEIVCPPCAESLEKLLGDGSMYPGEHVKYVKGTNVGHVMQPDRGTICDQCGSHIAIGAPCIAVTIWADNSPRPYQPWESDFIEVDDDE